MSTTLDRLKSATVNTPYHGRLFLVGGYPRDRFLGLPTSDDVDIVLEDDALELARFLYDRGLSDHAPVLYPRFGTAMIAIEGHNVELVTARAESYAPDSRKPNVRKATIHDDILRRDFTINTLLENLHTGEILDLTGSAYEDLRAGIIRTPLEPKETFFDDPLRMLRAIRFAVRFGFQIEESTWSAICEESHRLNLMGPEPPVVSAERIRDEFVKVVMANRHPTPTLNPNPDLDSGVGAGVGFPSGMELLRKSGLLAQFLPELLEMVGVAQNDWHLYDVWTHTMVALDSLAPDSSLEVRLGLLFHDVGKPRTKTLDEKGIHFYEHQFVGADMARTAMNRLKFTNDQIRHVFDLVSLHMRLGEAKPEWSDAAVKRLIRACGSYLDDLFEISRCDISAMRQDVPHAELAALRYRIDELNRLSDIVHIKSPLDGIEIMHLLNVEPGPILREAKEFLINTIIEGAIAEGDKEGASDLLKNWSAERSDGGDLIDPTT